MFLCVSESLQNKKIKRWDVFILKNWSSVGHDNQVWEVELSDCYVADNDSFVVTRAGWGSE